MFTKILRLLSQKCIIISNPHQIEVNQILISPESLVSSWLRSFRSVNHWTNHLEMCYLITDLCFLFKSFVLKKNENQRFKSNRSKSNVIFPKNLQSFLLKCIKISDPNQIEVNQTLFSPKSRVISWLRSFRSVNNWTNHLERCYLIKDLCFLLMSFVL